MQHSLVWTSARALTATVVAAVLLTPTSVDVRSAQPSVFQSVVSPPRQLAIELRASVPSAFENERAMSASELIDRWAPFIDEASKRFKISAAWIKAVMRMESGGRTLLGELQPITSSAGAMGIMQVMPATYRDMREQHGLGADPQDPRDNVLAGTAYLRWLYEKYGYPKMFAAYNAGPKTVEAQMAGSRRLPTETQAYVKGVAKLLGTKLPADEPAARPAKPAPDKIVAKLTRPDGSPVTIDAATVDKIRAPFPNEFVSGVQTVVKIGERQQGVREDLATVASVLKREPAAAS
jgi:membrane-bound lytic murein transglycosylase B